MSSADAVLEHGRDGGTFAAIAVLAELASAADVADACNEAMRRSYWELRDVQLSVGLAYAGTALLLRLADDERDATVERDLQIAVKGLLYNIASFTWPGWDEEGIEIAPSDQAAGLDAARASLDLVERLDLDELQRSRSHWMLGAHLLTSGEHAAAVDSFDQAIESAGRAGKPTDEKLATAFRALAGLADGSLEANEDLDAALDDLSAVEHGPDFVTQVTTARRVLGL